MVPTIETNRPHIRVLVAPKKSGRLTASGRRQFRTNKGFHLTPNRSVAFNSGVVLREYSEEPRILIALDVLRSVVKTKIAKNPRVLFVGGSNFRLAAE